MTMKNRGFCTACRASYRDGPLYRSKVDNNLYCIRHYNQMLRAGKILSINKIRGAFKPNKIIKHNNHVEIILENRNKKEIARTKVDTADYGKVISYRWYLSERGYVRAKFMREGECKRLRLHSFLLGEKKGFISDHINNDPLDNRKNNLRHVTYAQNTWNSSSIKKYTAYKIKDKFVCGFKYKNQKISLGKWDTREEAIDIAKKFQSFLYGEYGYNKN